MERVPHRGVFCNRTLNLRAIKAVGYDMDYTLVHYNVDAWEQRAYEYLRQKLLERGWPVAGLEYQRGAIVRGLIIDRKLGNIVKADRFGYVKRAYHGARRLGFDEQREVYSRVQVDLSDGRWVFLNTFFSLSEACMYFQLVDRLDAERFGNVMGYADLYDVLRRSLDEAHAEGRLKEEIVASPEAYVEIDPDAALTLLDQKEAGKRLLLITNSEWPFTQRMMRYCFDPLLPSGMTWRQLFDLVIVSSRKPAFFEARNPLFEVVSEDGLLRPAVGGLREGGVFVGGDAAQVEHYLGLSGAEILYVGDHLYTDVWTTKNMLRWRTALLVRELEDELAAVVATRSEHARLDALMAEKESLESEYSHARLQVQRRQRKYGPAPSAGEPLDGRVALLRSKLEKLDAEIAPLANALGELFNTTWGPLMRTGADKSLLARQIERYADVYTSRVSNLLYETPFAFLRSPRGSLPHDPMK